MLNATRQMSAPAERAGVGYGEAGHDPVSDEASNPRHDTGNTGLALLQAVLTRENLQHAWKRVKANKGAAGVDGLDIDQTARAFARDMAAATRTTAAGDVPAQSGARGNDCEAGGWRA